MTGPAVDYLRLWRSSDLSHIESGRHKLAAEMEPCMPMDAAVK
jgi:hypothetical protein